MQKLETKKIETCKAMTKLLLRSKETSSNVVARVLDMGNSTSIGVITSIDF